MAPDDSPGSATGRRLQWAVALLGGWMAVEAVGGWWTGSLALLSDAGHMASDVAALVLALLAARLARRSPTPRQTFGFHRAEVLAALINASALMAVAASVFWEALHRLQSPPEVLGVPMLVIAAGGLLVNAGAMLLLREHHRHDLNTRAAFLHLVGDTLGSLGAVASGVALVAWDARWADPVVSIGIGVLLVVSGLRLLREVLDILMEGMPHHLDPEGLRERILATPGVKSFHDLHVWTLSSGREVLSCHLVLDGTQPPRAVQRGLRERLALLGLHHLTVQIEEEDCGEDCASGSTPPAA
ncbi:MAG TPA: cation diffusion facilitator family transporter [Myxococcota bacterium]|nr:cation diffusion facilitator family transporter [Myxococcota bacterium]HQK50006.1 cation diffusion facilitator family transporter [Myxococcota bacterium]